MVNVPSPQGAALQERDTLAALLGKIADHHVEGDLRQALAVADKSLGQHSTSFVLHNARAVVLASLGLFSEAVASYRAALRLAPREPAIWSNLGNALTHLRHHESAVACHDAAIALVPEDGGPRYNRGISLAEAGRYSDAAVAFTQALTLDPGHRMAAWDRGRSYLHMGNLAAGWADYEVRLHNGLVPPREVPGQAWDGTPYHGRTLLLLSEQGFGDMLWVSRYLARAKALGGVLVVECLPELVALYAGLGIADRIVAKGASLPHADLHAWQCSLPGIFTLTPDTIPPVPNMAADPGRIAGLRPLMATAPGTLRIGIVWSGSTTFVRNDDRATSLARFIDAFDQPGVQLFSLQKGPPEAEMVRCAPHRIIDLAPHLHGFDDTAAAIALLDLVIMTDSAVAHLAGSMGRPVWVLLGRAAHWLWLQERSDSPWYPSMRLFRPRGETDWAHVFDSAASALVKLRAA